MSISDWVPVASALVVAILAGYQGSKKGQFWHQTKRSFRRRPFLNIALLILPLGALLLVMVPSARPEWLTANSGYIKFALAAAFTFLCVFVTWEGRKPEKTWERRQNAQPKFEDDARRIDVRSINDSQSN